MINILIGGDVCPIGRNSPFFKMGDAANIFNDLLVEFQNADLSIVNLECPLINERTPLLKNGPVLGVESDCINGLKKAGIDVVNLANNHILDHGRAGLMNTLKICQE
ncbi:MAG: CapA family protein, partial [Nitrosopumilaceae archaeon]